LQLRGSGRRADDDHRAAQRRQGRPRALDGRPAGSCTRASTGANLRARCRRVARFSLFSSSPLGGNSAWRPRSRKVNGEEQQARNRRRTDDMSTDAAAAAHAEDKRVLIFDTTLRDGEQSPGISLNRQEKLEIAHQLARLGVDIIEAGFPITSPGDFESVQAIAREVEGPVICGLARTSKQDIDAAWNAVRDAPRPRIHT